MSGFIVRGPKSDYRDSSRLKNGLYPFYNYNPQTEHVKHFLIQLDRLCIRVACNLFMIPQASKIHMVSEVEMAERKSFV